MDGAHHEGPECRCRNCGFVVEALAIVRDELAVKESLINDVQRRNMQLQSQLSAFKNAELEEAKESPWANEAREVFDYWRTELHPKARIFTDERRKAVIGLMRHGYTVAELKQAIDGARIAAYVGANGDVHDDLELICRNEQKVMRFIGAAKREAERVDGEQEEEGRAGATPQTAARERELLRFRSAMNDMIADRLATLRGWNPKLVDELELGVDGGRVVFPARDGNGHLVGFGRYAPNAERRGGAPKLLAEGERELFPRPERYLGGTAWLVEGEADAIAAITCGLQAIGVPGVGTWKAGWADRLGRFDQVNICFDCDEQGRAAASARQHALHTLVTVKVVDIDKDRDDSFDVSDLVLTQGPQTTRRFLEGQAALAASVAPMTRGPGIRVNPPVRSRDPIQTVLDALEAHGMRVTGSGSKYSAQCPAHDDRHASMSLSVGDKGDAVLTCHAGCRTEDIVSALALSWPDLFSSSA